MSNPPTSSPQRCSALHERGEPGCPPRRFSSERFGGGGSGERRARPVLLHASGRFETTAAWRRSENWGRSANAGGVVPPKPTRMRRLLCKNGRRECVVDGTSRHQPVDLGPAAALVPVVGSCGSRVPVRTRASMSSRVTTAAPRQLRCVRGSGSSLSRPGERLDTLRPGACIMRAARNRSARPFHAGTARCPESSARPPSEPAGAGLTARDAKRLDYSRTRKVDPSVRGRDRIRPAPASCPVYRAR